jgi:hypothetical protein
MVGFLMALMNFQFWWLVIYLDAKEPLKAKRGYKQTIT